MKEVIELGTDDEIPEGHFLINYRGMKFFLPEGQGPLAEFIEYFIQGFISAGVMKMTKDGKLVPVPPEEGGEEEKKMLGLMIDGTTGEGVRLSDEEVASDLERIRGKPN